MPDAASRPTIGRAQLLEIPARRDDGGPAIRGEMSERCDTPSVYALTPPLHGWHFVMAFASRRVYGDEVVLWGSDRAGRLRREGFRALVDRVYGVKDHDVAFAALGYELTR